ncbi:Crp/Fnr family transcriptional regulator [Solirubrobacter taibaiensis]|nr:Crp/Fnr family transcriptional regulator [Solirubrobacter taibaiensis]
MTEPSLGRRLLLDVDPDLGRLLEGERLRSARSALSVRTTVVPVGEWDLSGLGRVSPANMGLMLLDGAVARELSLGATVSSELLGPGDLVRPWTLDSHARGVESMTYWNVLSAVRVALLDQRLTSRLSEYPEVTAMLMDRLSARSQRLAMLQAIAHLNRVDARVEAALWLLADRWGRPKADGIVVPLTLSHRAIGQIVGAARPTVSTAFARLAHQQRVVRQRNGTWWLNPDCRPSAVPARDRGIRQRRNLFPVTTSDLDAADWADQLAGGASTPQRRPDAAVPA